MIKDKKWESLVWIVIGITILSFCILWIVNIINYSTNLIDSFTKNVRLNILKDNLSHITDALDTNNIAENELFYIYKNSTGSVFQIFTWATNVGYKYIDENGNKVDDTTNFEWPLYSRVLWLTRDSWGVGMENELIKSDIKRIIKS